MKSLNALAVYVWPSGTGTAEAALSLRAVVFLLGTSVYVEVFAVLLPGDLEESPF